MLIDTHRGVVEVRDPFIRSDSGHVDDRLIGVDLLDRDRYRGRVDPRFRHVQLPVIVRIATDKDRVEIVGRVARRGVIVNDRYARQAHVTRVVDRVTVDDLIPDEAHRCYVGILHDVDRRVLHHAHYGVVEVGDPLIRRDRGHVDDILAGIHLILANRHGGGVRPRFRHVQFPVVVCVATDKDRIEIVGRVARRGIVILDSYARQTHVARVVDGVGVGNLVTRSADRRHIGVLHDVDRRVLHHAHYGVVEVGDPLIRRDRGHVDDILAGIHLILANRHGGGVRPRFRHVQFPVVVCVATDKDRVEVVGRVARRGVVILDSYARQAHVARVVDGISVGDLVTRSIDRRHVGILHDVDAGNGLDLSDLLQRDRLLTAVNVNWDR